MYASRGSACPVTDYPDGSFIQTTRTSDPLRLDVTNPATYAHFQTRLRQLFSLGITMVKGRLPAVPAFRRGDRLQPAGRRRVAATVGAGRPGPARPCRMDLRAGGTGRTVAANPFGGKLFASSGNGTIHLTVTGAPAEPQVMPAGRCG